MKDDKAISLNRAIDAVHKNYDKILDFKSDGKTISSSIEDILSELPPAQPEQQWIPVTERLPRNMLYVLVTYKHEHGPIDYGIARYSETEHKWYTSRKVIAWMPLPAPYLERGQNG